MFLSYQTFLSLVEYLDGLQRVFAWLGSDKGKAIQGWQFNLKKHPPKEPASIAYMISLQAMLWRSVSILEMVWCKQPDRMCKALSE